MSDDLKSALIAGSVALVVAVFSAIVSFLINRKVLKQAQYESKRTGITVQRMAWIGEIRNLFAELFTFDLNDMLWENSKYDQFNKTIQLLKLYLNFGGYIDSKILDSMNALMESAATAISENVANNDLNGTFEKEKGNMQKYAQIYLKSEWNRVKFESDPKNADKKYNEEEAIKELEKKYEVSETYINSRPSREADYVRKMLSNNSIKS